MTGFESVCVAAVEATPVILDADATIDKVIGLLGEAADGGATLVVFRECFVSANGRIVPARCTTRCW